jgi:hypothetical protein
MEKQLTVFMIVMCTTGYNPAVPVKPHLCLKLDIVPIFKMRLAFKKHVKFRWTEMKAGLLIS